MSKADTGTCVILVCVTNKANKILTHDKFFKIFSGFGKIQRILIFERAVIWKTFIEYDNIESANKAKIGLNGQDFGDENLKMNVYASQLDRITFQENNSGGVDYTILRQKIEEKSNKSSQSVTSPGLSTSQMKSFGVVSPQYKQNCAQAQKVNKKMTSSVNFPYQGFQEQNNVKPLIQSVSIGSQFGNPYPNGFLAIPHQIQLQQLMQQQIQKMNSLMFMLQQVNTDQQFLIQYNYDQQQSSIYERQITVIKELTESNVKIQQLIEQYQRLIYTTTQQMNNHYHQKNYSYSTQAITPLNLSAQFPQLNPQQQQQQQQVHSPGMVSGVISPQLSNKPLSKLKKFKQSLAKSSEIADNPQNGIKFVRSYGADSQQLESSQKQEKDKESQSIIYDEDLLLKQVTQQSILQTGKKLIEALDLDLSMKQSIQGDESHSDDDFQKNDNEKDKSLKLSSSINEENKKHQSTGSPLNKKGSYNSENFICEQIIEATSGAENAPNNEDDEDEDQDNIFSCFNMKATQQNVDTKQILQKMSADINQGNQKDQSVVAMIENQIQQNSLQKSSNSLDQIDQLINKNKLKQIEIVQSQNLNINPSPSYMNLTQQCASLQLEWKQKCTDSQQLYEDVREDQDPAEYVNPLFLKVVRKSKVIYARWFDRKVVTLRMLYNIFSTFGNIDKMIYLKDRSSALIQYQTIEHSTQAKESLNDIMFYEQMIKIFYSNYEEIFLKSHFIIDTNTQSPYEDIESGEEYFQGTPETQRFKEDQNYSFSPISDTIQVYNLSKEYCLPEKIFPIFESYGNIQKHKFFFHNSGRNVCVIKYENIQISLVVLANLHNTNLDGRLIQISFSKLKI